MINWFARYRKLAVLAAAAAIPGLPTPTPAAETARDPYAACVAAETASHPGSVSAEARARQKCRKLYPSATPTAPTGRVEVPSGIPLAGPSPSTPSSAPSQPQAEAPLVVPAPASLPMPATPAGGNPHGAPPGLSK